MKLYSWNVNGIRAVHRKGDLDRFLKDHDPDVFCIQETKAHQDQLEVDFPQYDEYWNSAEKKGYSGTAIFTKISPEDVFCGIPETITKQFNLCDTYGDTTKEGRVLTLEFEEYYVSTVYTPNAKDDLTRIPVRTNWDAAFLAYMSMLEATKPVLFCGDLNVAHTSLDLARPKENEGKKGFTQEERDGFEKYVAAGFVDTFREMHPEGGQYTWWSHFANARERNVGWRIDYILASRSLLPIITRANIHPGVMGSDHCPTSIEFNLEVETP